ncbi:major facilitator superfamily domain-containing protein 12-like [Anthonomus grandis grandis]|uniref:major facilitator superfamily domain-containing protein 12-like n=1 Tax=Anthonomus grandis grandis TaxID=2921223 RepID=UPI002166A138|nr:major facilitator superfamily domain-containing protein 12-like [Anthonomus grandis grandis]
MEIEEPFTPTCGIIQKMSYGLGHVLNDLCAAMWFSYTLFYLHVVLSIPSTTAGTLLMIGQVIDSVATPLAGWAIDLTGHRRAWHFGGTIAVAIGFSLLFSIKPTELTTSILAYYILSISMFQIGWAVVQISHLSIIPEISRNHSHSSDLTAIRYTASVTCSIIVYLITLVVLQTDDNSTIGPQDFYKFKEIALLIVSMGLLTSLFFYCGLLGTYETEYEVIRESDDVNNLNTKSNRHFLRHSIIYLVALMYMASRLFTILNLIYIPLYLDERGATEVVEKEKMRQRIATIPLVSYIASFLMSLFLKFKGQCLPDKLTYLIGGTVGIISSIWLGVGISPNSDSELYAIATLLGISGSSTMVASLCLTANFVKANGYGGGLVYSIVTFTDKLISGGVVLLVQNLQCTPKSLCPHYYEHVLSYICGIVSLIGIISLLILELEIKKNGMKTEIKD